MNSKSNKYQRVARQKLIQQSVGCIGTISSLCPEGKGKINQVNVRSRFHSDAFIMQRLKKDLQGKIDAAIQASAVKKIEVVDPRTEKMTPEEIENFKISKFCRSHKEIPLCRSVLTRICENKNPISPAQRQSVLRMIKVDEMTKRIQDITERAKK